MKTERDMKLLGTKELGTTYGDTLLTIAITGQEGLTIKQLVTIERLYKNWDSWKVRFATWLINKTEL